MQRIALRSESRLPNARTCLPDDDQNGNDDDKNILMP